MHLYIYIYIYIYMYILVGRCKRVTVNVEIFAQYIFSIISRRALDARTFDVSENYNHNRTNRNKQHMCENLNAPIRVIGLDARKFSCAKISMFTVPIQQP